jgi:cellulose synthase/poly-beta-1,6-N-acetylglucosamine synthase-like glycosyltransferase
MDNGDKAEVKGLAERYGFIYSVRTDRPRLRKAGNLRWRFTHTDGEFFVIYDADFCPRPDFFNEVIPQHLADDKAAIIQVRL